MSESLAEIAFLGFAERATQVRAGGNDGCYYLIQGKWPQPQSSSSVLGAAKRSRFSMSGFLDPDRF